MVNPSHETYKKIMQLLSNPASTQNYDFADQSLLSDAFPGRWVPLPYVYNALKTMRWKGVHDAIWRDEEVKNIHYILSPKPWDESEEVRRENPADRDPLNERWWQITDARKEAEHKSGIDDGF